MNLKSFIKKIIVWILTLEARLVLLRYKPRIVGITGSVGKTSTKDAIFTALGSSFYVRKSQKSFNTELGIPLTILGCDNAWNNPLLWLKNILKGFGVILLPNHYPDWLVLEVGLDRPGDIARVIKWVRFDVVVYTRLSEAPVHVEFFDSVEELLSEKRLLAGGLKDSGALVVNADDPLQEDIKRDGCTKFTYGTGEHASVNGTHVQVAYGSDGSIDGMTFRVEHGGSSVPIELFGVLGEQHVYPVLAGCAVGISQDINLVDITRAFKYHEMLPGRMRVLEGRDGSTIIDDSYNASPIATHAALDVLDKLELPVGGEGKKICMLADMTELGNLTQEAHRKVGEHVAGVADVFISVGGRMEVAREAAMGHGMNQKHVIALPSARKAGEYVRDRLHRGDVVLIKGSQAMRMEKAVEKLLAHPEKARELLVRQDKAWLARP